MIGLAKGCWQREFLGELLEGKEVTNPLYYLRGKAKNYSGRYRTSLDNLLIRVKGAGVEIRFTPGVRGGSYSGTYQIV